MIISRLQFRDGIMANMLLRSKDIFLCLHSSRGDEENQDKSAKELNGGCKFVCAGWLLADETTAFCIPNAKISTYESNIGKPFSSQVYILILMTSHLQTISNHVDEIIGHSN